METIYNNRQFMVFNISEITNINFDEVLETSIETIRKSVDGSKIFVKWDGDKIPNSVDSLTTKEGPYTYDEILKVLETPEWVDEYSVNFDQIILNNNE